MPDEGRPFGTAVHASAVAISRLGLLILGPSGAGKSRLAFALIAASSRRRPIRLVGDDRILLAEIDGKVMARPHPRIEGFMERRGLGLVACPFIAPVRVGALVILGPTTSKIALAQNFPCLRFVDPDEADAGAVLSWWRGACTTPAAKSSGPARGGAKD